VQRQFNDLPFSKPMLKTLFSLRTAIMVFEKPTTIRRPLSYATTMRDGRTRRDVASAPSPMKPYNPLFIWSLQRHPSFSLHCYTNPLTMTGFRMLIPRTKLCRLARERSPKSPCLPMTCAMYRGASMRHNPGSVCRPK
jgi:hypothetical protein